MDMTQQPDQKIMGMYKVLELAAAKKIYDPQASKGLVQTMKAAGDPAAAVAHATVIVLDDLRQAVAQKIPPQMVDAVAPAVVAMLCDLANAAGLFKATPAIVQKAVALIKQNRQQPARPAAQPAQAAQSGIIGSAMGAQ